MGCKVVLGILPRSSSFPLPEDHSTSTNLTLLHLRHVNALLGETVDPRWKVSGEVTAGSGGRQGVESSS